MRRWRLAEGDDPDAHVRFMRRLVWSTAFSSFVHGAHGAVSRRFLSDERVNRDA